MQNTLKTPLITVLFLFACLYLFATFFGPIPFSVNSIVTTKTDLFTVEGTGEATGIPDTAMVTIGVTKQAATVQEAQNQVNKITNKITTDLKAQGVKVNDIKTTNYSVSPDYDFSGGRQQVKGYTVSQNLEIKLQPIEMANKAIDIATAAGANVIGSVSFILDDDEQKKLEAKARKEAIDNAKEKAEQTAKLAGIKLGRIVNIFESPSMNRPVPVFAQAMKAGDSMETESPPTQLNPGENTIHITVTLSYQTF